MNFLIVFVAVFAVAYGDANCTSSTKPNLEDDIKAITKLIPVSKIKAIALKYIANDAEVQAVVKYMKGSEFAALVKAVNDEKLVKDLYTFLCSNGVDIYKDVNTVNKLLELPEVQPQGRVLPAARTFRGFLDEVEAELPLGDMKKVFEQKKATSAVFKAFFDKISGSEFRAMVDKFWALKTVQDIKTKLEALGADVDKAVKLLKNLLGWVSN
ncbi:protein G12-like [Bacillus rossius redtenbacheri]|uniref:protein G12-like n=1 Tax=Bacillus rossius redtenbacheri TaxID=93214 RepID=UPI002FDD07F2